MPGLTVFVLATALIGLATWLSGPARPGRTRFLPAFGWTLLWLALPLGFGFLLYAVEPTGGLLGLGKTPDPALHFLTTYFSQISLTALNLLLMALILARWRVPISEQGPVLTGGFLGIVASRGVLLPAGLGLLLGGDNASTAGALYLFAAGLVAWTCDHPSVAAAFQRRGGSQIAPRLKAGWGILLLNLIASGASAPLGWSYSREPAMVLAANLFAVMGLRSMYGLVAGLLPRLRPLKAALSGLLLLSGFLLVVEGSWFPGPERRLPIVLGGLVAGVLLSLLRRRRHPERLPSPVRPFDLTTILIDNGRRIVVSVLGFSLILMGLVLLLLPGPGLLVILGGLAVLSLEFVWAGRLLRRARRQFNETMDWMRSDNKKSPNRPRKEPEEEE